MTYLRYEGAQPISESLVKTLNKTVWLNWDPAGDRNGHRSLDLNVYFHTN